LGCFAFGALAFIRQGGVGVKALAFGTPGVVAVRVRVVAGGVIVQGGVGVKALQLAGLGGNQALGSVKRGLLGGQVNAVAGLERLPAIVHRANQGVGIHGLLLCAAGADWPRARRYRCLFEGSVAG